jgi:photosystem II stability/assembly factor-like uncharacterized protein
MPFMQVTLLYCLLIFFTGGQASEYSASSETEVVESAKNAEATNIILQSKDGGQTWEDISRGLPEREQRVGFYAGASEIYLSTNGLIYSSKNNLKTPAWEKENGLDPLSSITFTRSGVRAITYDGKIYQKKSSSETWLPIYTNFKSQSVASFFEASDGAVFFSTGKNFFKSTGKALTWKLVHKGHVGEILESEGVLLATGQQGILRSTDNGEQWELVISEGGVGIALERIDGGFAAIVYNTTTKSRRIHISLDGGETWQAIDEGLQPTANISSVKQMGKDLFVGHPDGIFRSPDMGKTWKRVHAGFGDEHLFKFMSLNPAPAPVEKVWKVYVSGTVLYAVAVSPGC